MTVFDLPSTEALIRAALEEDTGRGDLTTWLTVPAGLEGHAEIVAKEQGVLAGLPLARKIFDRLGATEVTVRAHLAEGETLLPGSVVATFQGPVSYLLTGERVVLNFLQHLSGVATLTRRYVEAISGTGARILDTRKTRPGLRLLEKYAVRVGGGRNHRLGLDDGVLIKDNHIIAAGGLRAAVERARAGAPHVVRIEVECDTLSAVEEALTAGADTILLDNMSVEQIAQAVRSIGGRALVEASGGISLQTVRATAETGVDLISVGALTHSAPALDLSMRIEVG